jgi:hypothetical protein
MQDRLEDFTEQPTRIARLEMLLRRWYTNFFFFSYSKDFSKITVGIDRFETC